MSKLLIINWVPESTDIYELKDHEGLSEETLNKAHGQVINVDEDVDAANEVLDWIEANLDKEDRLFGDEVDPKPIKGNFEQVFVIDFIL